MSQMLTPLLVALLSACLLRVTLCDWRSRTIRNIDNLAIALLGAVYVWSSGADKLAALLGAFAAIAGLAAIAEIYRARSGKTGLGYGDVKLAGAAGVWIGWPLLPLFLFLSSVTGLFWVAVLTLSGRSADVSAGVPFGPFLGLGLLATLAVKILAPEWLSYLV